MPVLLRTNRNLITPSPRLNQVGSRATLSSRRSELILRPSVDVSSRGGTSNDVVGSRRCSSLPGIQQQKLSAVPSASSGRGPLVQPTAPKTFLEPVKVLYKRLHLKYLLPLVFIMIYMFLGAFLFLWLEGPTDRLRKLHDYRLYAHERELFLKRIDEIFNDEASRKPKQRRHFFEEAIDYLHQQIGVSFSNQSDWSISTALYYSGTVFTTIGYGDVACNTPIGRLMTVVYAIVGIPLMLITLNDLGKFLYKTINNFVRLVRLKSRLARILGVHIQKASMQQPYSHHPDLAQLEAGTLVNAGNGNGHEAGYGTGINTENDDGNESKKIKFQISSDLAEESVKEEETATLTLDDGEISPGTPPPRMPVLVAIGITVSWIFLCAALFKLWEHDWTYGESCYFMFISLSTIGLGDLSVKRRDLMVMCFMFVIIGLSMVSMCINVIQASLEDLYIKILMKLILEYQSRLDQGNDEMGASVGMMQMWGSNKTAKYLMPLLSKNKRMTAMAKVQENAEAQGIEIPPIFSDIDEESGMPKLFSHHVDESSVVEAVEEALQYVESVQRVQPIPEAPLPKTVFYDSDAQTDLAICDDKAEQTSVATLMDTAIVTDPLTNELVEEAVQCDSPILVSGVVQTELVETREDGCMTIIPDFVERIIQTEEAVLIEQEIQTHVYDVLEAVTQTPVIEVLNTVTQTHVHEALDTVTQTDVHDVLDAVAQTYVYDNLEADTQTEIHEYVTEPVQTPFPEMTESEVQTEPMEEVKPASRISRAKKRIKRAFGGSKGLRRQQPALPEMSEWREPTEEEEEEEEEEGMEEVEEEPSSSESLVWDPVDGMHAEKQRPVRDLTKFFEKTQTVEQRRRAPSLSRTQRRPSKSTRSRAASLAPKS